MQGKYITKCLRCGFESGWAISSDVVFEHFICYRCGAIARLEFNAGAYAFNYTHEGIGQGHIPYDMKLSEIRELIKKGYIEELTGYLTLWDDTTNNVKFLVGDEEMMAKMVEAIDYPYYPARK